MQAVDDVRKASSTDDVSPSSMGVDEVKLRVESIKHEIEAHQDSAQQAQWEIVSELGKGGSGAVYRGVWRGLDVAIKRVVFQIVGGGSRSPAPSSAALSVDRKGPHQAAEPDKVTALREAAINQTLNHPNCVRTYHFDIRPVQAPQVRPGRGEKCYLRLPMVLGGNAFNPRVSQLHSMPPYWCRARSLVLWIGSCG